MGQILICVICITLIVVGVMSMMQSSFISVDMVSQSWKDMGLRTGDIARTRVTDMAENTVGGGGADLTITIMNNGEIPLLCFDEWDIVVQYYSSGPTLQIRYVAYDNAAPLGDNQWAVEGIYLDASAAQAEVYEPDIFNPREEMKISIKLNPVIAGGTNGVVTVGTSSGVTAEVPFSG